MKIRTSTHYQLHDFRGMLYVAPKSHWTAMICGIAAKSNRFFYLGFYDNDIICGSPIGAPMGAQLLTEAESDMERARR